MKLEIQLTAEEVQQACLEYARKAYTEVTPDTHYCMMRTNPSDFSVTAEIGEKKK